MSDQRDRIEELRAGLEAMFGERVVSYQLTMNRTQNHIHPFTHQMGRNGNLLIPIAQSYQLTVDVNISVASLLKMPYLKSDSWIHSLAVGEHVPVEVQHTQDLAQAKMVLRVVYNVVDLDGFIDDLSNSAWKRFSAEFTEALDRVLDDRDKE